MAAPLCEKTKSAWGANRPRPRRTSAATFPALAVVGEPAIFGRFCRWRAISRTRTHDTRRALYKYDVTYPGVLSSQGFGLSTMFGPTRSAESGSPRRAVARVEQRPAFTAAVRVQRQLASSGSPLRAAVRGDRRSALSRQPVSLERDAPRGQSSTPGDCDRDQPGASAKPGDS